MVVPVIRQPRVNLRALPGVRQQITVPAGAFDRSGGTAGQALSNIGAGLQPLGSELMDQAIQQQIEANEASAEGAYTEWLSEMTSLTTEFSQLNDLGPSEQRQSFDSRADELTSRVLGGLTTERARQMAQEQIARRRVAFAGAWDQHMSTQTTAARGSALQARIDQEVNAAVLNPTMTLSSLAAIDQLVAQQNPNAPPEVLSELQRSYRSTIHTAHIGRLFNAGDVAGAMSYLDQYRDTLSTDDLLRVEGLLRTSAHDAHVDALVRGAEGGRIPTGTATPFWGATGRGTVGPAIVNGEATEVVYWSIEQIESAHTWPENIGAAGEMGVMQVIHDTARMTLAAHPDLVIEFGGAVGPDSSNAELEAFFHDPDHPERGRRLGRVHYNDLIRQYGDPFVAAAAYNAGAGAANRYLNAYGDPRTDAITHAAWAQAIRDGGNATTARYLETLAQLLSTEQGLDAQIAEAADAPPVNRVALTPQEQAEAVEPVAGAAGPPEALDFPGRLVFWGDSYANGYGAAAARRADNVVRLGVNGAGYSGGTRVRDISIRHGDTVIMSVGANDRHLSPEGYRAALLQSVQQVMERGGEAVIIGMAESDQLPHAEEFNAMAMEVASDLGATYLPGRAADAPDGLHYTAGTYEDVLMGALRAVGQPVAPSSAGDVAEAPAERITSVRPSYATTEEIVSRPDPTPHTTAVSAAAVEAEIDRSVGGVLPTRDDYTDPRDNERERWLAERRRIEASGASEAVIADALDIVDARHADRLRIIDEQRAGLLRDAYAAIREGAAPSSLGIEIRSDPELMAAVRAYQASFFQRDYDFQLYDELMHDTDPDVLASLDLERMVRPYVSPDQYRDIENRRSNIIAARQTASDAADADITLAQQFTALWDTLGLAGAGLSERDRQRRGWLRDGIQRAIAAETAERGRALTTQERQEVMDRIVAGSIVTESGPIVGWVAPLAPDALPTPLYDPAQQETLSVLEIDSVSDIPEDERERLYQAAIEEGIPLNGPDDPRIVGIYISTLGNLP